MIAAHALGKQTYGVTSFECLHGLGELHCIPRATGGQFFTCMSISITSELSTSPSAKSLRLLMGTVPADSINQLVNVLRPNWVDLAVRRSILRV